MTIDLPASLKELLYTTQVFTNGQQQSSKKLKMIITSSSCLFWIVLQLLGILNICTAFPVSFRNIATIKRSAADIDSCYDYIIVGGGTSGLTVADRLTEDGTSEQLTTALL